ncbi:MAG: cardiolipin synthase [Proteobacteria bacterium]|nr:cardiolipin synthase [Pseudomonadota bacterium]MBU1420680.1 cardiolipin synthase [Pseudomonadota bacterium]MBU1454597.1 cardiolipin synthase [Pseudomonadota bacterium]
MAVETYHWGNTILPIILPLADLAIRLGLSIRVIMRQRQYGVTLAWLIVILLLPFLGAIVYLFFGENRIGETRASRTRNSLEHYHKWLSSLRNNAQINWSKLDSALEPIHRQADALIGIPALDGNSLELIEEPEKIMRAIIKDINAATSTCHLQFYIWHEGGTADEVIGALIRAAARGVTCRILVDAIGSKNFLKGEKVKELRAAGIRVLESLPAGFFKAIFVRIDIRNHRKIVVIDGKIAYPGSQNMIDPRFFKQDSGVGQWVDIMVRIQGPVVEPIAGTFISDWFLETDNEKVSSRSLEEDIEQVRSIADIRPQPFSGDIPVQLVPSGPDFTPEAIHNLLLTTIYAAQKNITLTTPYFVPDESLLTALQSAAQRGVDVRIIVPKINDSKLVHYASRARYESLATRGVSIMLFTGGLLHSKTITVDDKFALFGSVNLDMRSFWLNFEATLFIYSSSFTTELRQVQRRYESQAQPLDLEIMARRSYVEKFFENSALLIGPLL